MIPVRRLVALKSPAHGAKGMVSPNPALQDRIYRERMEIFRADVPGAFFFPGVEFIIAHRCVRGLSSPWRADPVKFME